MNDLIKAIEKAGEFDVLKSSSKYDQFITQYPNVSCDSFKRPFAHSYWQSGARHQHSELQWAVEALKIAVEALKLRNYHDADCLDALDDFKEDETCECGNITVSRALEQIAALVPKGDL